MKIATKALTTLVTVFSGGYEDLDIIADQEGLDIYAISKDKTMLMSARISKDQIEDYEPQERFGIDIKDIMDALKNMGEKTSLRLTEGGARLELESDGLKAVLPLPAPPEGKRTSPSLNLKAGFMCDLDPLRKVLAMSKSSLVRVSVGPMGVVMSSMDEKGCGPKAELPPSALLSVEGTASASYGVGQLTGFMSRFPRGAIASFEFDDGYPVRISFTLEGVEGMCLIAPTIDDTM